MKYYTKILIVQTILNLILLIFALLKYITTLEFLLSIALTLTSGQLINYSILLKQYKNLSEQAIDVLAFFSKDNSKGED